MTTKVRLLVHFEFYPASKEAAEAVEYLHNVLNADLAVSSLQVPTYFTLDDGSQEPPEPRVATEADRVLVVLLADAHLAAAARRPTKSGTTWGEYATKLRSLTASPELTWAHHRTLPHSEELKQLYAVRGLTWDDYHSIASELKACGVSGLRNGLTVDESRGLATSRSAERIVELVLRGLQQCYPPVATGDAE
ncbi:hypothetical protein [Sorangium sp. So ce426]|uniref:hypothetical protein n=1 Tax=Sorangium sp. So ce426 TaxID=3133312 RepID=UPI003F5BC536